MNYYIVNAFATPPYRGNPAGVCILDEFQEDEILQKIAYENNLPETAFLVKEKQGYVLRWFTPLNEIDLCGHGTLATAYVVMNYLEPSNKSVEFYTKSGVLTVRREDNRYEMELPVRLARQIPVSEEIEKNMGIKPLEVYSERDLFIILDSEKAVQNYTPDYEKLSRLKDWLGIVITAKGTDADFVSRYFCPELKEEDPVTGSSHCTLVPIWSKKLQKNSFVARQLSERGGVLYCENKPEKIMIAGEAHLHLKGEIHL